MFVRGVIVGGVVTVESQVMFSAEQTGKRICAGIPKRTCAMSNVITTKLQEALIEKVKCLNAGTDFKLIQEYIAIIKQLETEKTETAP